MYERARELLQEAESKYPGSRCTGDLISLGWAACRVGRWEEALEAFAKVNTDDHASAWTPEVDVEIGKAVALYHTGRQEESLRQLVLAHHKLQRGNETGWYPQRTKSAATSPSQLSA